MRKPLVTIAILVGSVPSYADEVTYQRPPKAVASFVDAVYETPPSVAQITARMLGRTR